MLENSLQSNGLSESGSAPTSSTGVGGSNNSRKGGGKVTHDSRGNAVWEWGVATGVFARIKSHELLNMLDNPTLALEGECQLAGEWAGDPYNRR
jgi:hypothetical protein